MKLLNVPSPSKDGSASKIMPLENSYDAFQKRKEEMRNEVLGSDAAIARSGFIDTSRGSAIASAKALGLTPMNHDADVKTFQENAVKDAWRTATHDRRASAAAKKGRVRTTTIACDVVPQWQVCVWRILWRL